MLYISDLCRDYSGLDTEAKATNATADCLLIELSLPKLTRSTKPVSGNTVTNGSCFVLCPNLQDENKTNQVFPTKESQLEPTHTLLGLLSSTFCSLTQYVNSKIVCFKIEI